MKLYVVMHKPARYPQGTGFVPIQVGQADDFAALRDDNGENIAAKNASFCELTALYWIWKNDTSTAAGLVHYRRYFAKKHCIGPPWNRIASEETLEEILATCDMILPKKRHYYIETNYSQYAHAHHEKDLVQTRRVLEAHYPEYVPAFDAVMARRSGHRFNMLLCRREVLDAYCSWLFPILFALEESIDLSGYDAYNRRVFGFLGERLLDVWLENQELRIAELPVVNTEGENWLVKGPKFVMRKIQGTFHKT